MTPKRGVCIAKRRLITGIFAAAGAHLLPDFIGQSRAARPLITHRTIAEGETLGLAIDVRRLSLDPTSKGATNFYTFPVGWQGGGVAHYHLGSEEVFVLDGDITLDGSDYYVKGSYLYRPGGIVHGHHEGSIKGSRMLIRTGREIDFNYVREPTSPGEYVIVPSDDGRPHVLHLKSPAMMPTWIGSAADRYSRKTLSVDAKTGDFTALIEFPAAWRGRMAFEAGASWEWFIVAGQVTLDDGTVFETETYSYRPAGSGEHGFVAAAAGSQVLLWREV